MATENEIATKKYRRARWITLSLAAIVGLLGVIVFLGVGRWLVVQDPLEKAQAILVLSGGMPFRAEEAARLYREGYAPKVWLTHSAEPGATLSAMGLSYISEDAYNVRVLTHEGVPPSAIRLLHPDILNTADEISIASEALAQEKGSAVIIVTSKVHTRRARILWHRLAARQGTAIVRATSDDPFEPGRWWRTTADALDVVREVLGILNAWAGMPLRPER